MSFRQSAKHDEESFPAPPNTTNYIEIDFPIVDYIRTVRISDALMSESDLKIDEITLDHVLRALFSSLQHGDYFSLNAFLPFRGYGRREALERMRNRVASRLAVASCLEIGPRYLHSTGQLHKGGPNNGVFLFISADEDTTSPFPARVSRWGTWPPPRLRENLKPWRHATAGPSMCTWPAMTLRLCHVLPIGSAWLSVL
jgi:hypothetical protein